MNRKDLIQRIARGQRNFEPASLADDDRRTFDRLVLELQELAHEGIVTGLTSVANHESAIGDYNFARVQSLTAKGFRIAEGKDRPVGANVLQWAGVLGFFVVIIWLVTGDSRWEPVYTAIVTGVPALLFLVGRLWRQ